MKHRTGIPLLTAAFSLAMGLSARAHDLGSALPHPHPHPAPAGAPEAVFTLVAFAALIGLGALAFIRRRDSRPEGNAPRRVDFHPHR